MLRPEEKLSSPCLSPKISLRFVIHAPDHSWAKRIWEESALIAYEPTDQGARTIRHGLALSAFTSSIRIRKRSTSIDVLFPRASLSSGKPAIARNRE